MVQDRNIVAGHELLRGAAGTTRSRRRACSSAPCWCSAAACRWRCRPQPSRQAEVPWRRTAARSSSAPSRSPTAPTGSPPAPARSGARTSCRSPRCRPCSRPASSTTSGRRCRPTSSPEEPTAEVADDGTQTITYEINPDAVWSDGEPITSADFEYTALQIRDGDDIFDKTGYDRITAVDAQRPEDGRRHARLRVRRMAHAVQRLRRACRRTCSRARTGGAMMADGYDFSGGPWKIE